jgi:hypothetical protein
MPAGVPSTHRTPCSLTAAGQPIRFAEAAISLNRLSCRQENLAAKTAVSSGQGDLLCLAQGCGEGPRWALAPEGVVSLTGDTPMIDRQLAVDAFQTDPNIRFFVGNIQAAGVGITLTASSHVVFAEIDWVPANLSQAVD